MATAAVIIMITAIIQRHPGSPLRAWWDVLGMTLLTFDIGLPAILEPSDPTSCYYMELKK